jgi:hypothetical protein
LFEKLSAVNENQGGPSPSSDHVSSDNGLSKCRGRRQYPGFMLQKGRGRLILFSRQFAEKTCLKRPFFLAFVTQLGLGAYVAEKPQQIIEASPREGDVFRE